MSYLRTLPDPNYGTDSAGLFSDIEGLGSPFASVKLEMDRPLEEDATVGGRIITRSKAYSQWLVEVTYNPLTKAEFEPIHLFLLQKQGSIRSFDLILPQYREPKDSTFATFVEANPGLEIVNSANPGLTYLDISAPQWGSDDYSLTGVPSVGDMFNITDSTDTLHTKAYIVNRVETPENYLSGTQPSSGTMRIHFSPGIQRAVPDTATIKFFEPRLRVVAKDTNSYNLDNNNLYTFKLQLEEAMY